MCNLLESMKIFNFNYYTLTQAYSCIKLSLLPKVTLGVL